MKQLVFIFAVALTSCGTTSDFASAYSSSGSPFGNFIQPGPSVSTRAKAISNNSGTIINPGTSTGMNCPGSSSGNNTGTIVTRPTSSIDQNSLMNGKSLINQIGNQVRRQSSPTQRRIVRKF
jgi:hypothetical protein